MKTLLLACAIAAALTLPAAAEERCTKQWHPVLKEWTIACTDGTTGSERWNPVLKEARDGDSARLAALGSVRAAPAVHDALEQLPARGGDRVPVKPPSAADLRRQLGTMLSIARQRLDLPMRDVNAKCDLSETYYGMIECAWAASAQCGRSPLALANFGGKRANDVGPRNAERCDCPQSGTCETSRAAGRRRPHGAAGGKDARWARRARAPHRSRPTTCCAARRN